MICTSVLKSRRDPARVDARLRLIVYARFYSAAFLKGCCAGRQAIGPARRLIAGEHLPLGAIVMRKSKFAAARKIRATREADGEKDQKSDKSHFCS